MANTIANVLTGVAVVSVKYPVGGSYVDVGYTEDGVIFEYTADMSDIEVEEETFPIDRRIVKETAAVIVNMAESSLANMNFAMAGGVVAGSVLTLGGGTNKEASVKIVGTNPAGYDRTIEIPLATAVGTVGIPYKKGEKSVVPVRFEALKGASDPVTITDATS